MVLGERMMVVGRGLNSEQYNRQQTSRVKKGPRSRFSPLFRNPNFDRRFRPHRILHLLLTITFTTPSLFSNDTLQWRTLTTPETPGKITSSKFVRLNADGLSSSPWVVLNDFGGAFAMGAIGGGIWHGIKGARNSPRVSTRSPLMVS